MVLTLDGVLSLRTLCLVEARHFVTSIIMIFHILQIAIPFIWFGLVGGISFIETPLKFRAPNITLALGLGIGRIVFSALNKVEIALAFCSFLPCFSRSRKINLGSLFRRCCVFINLANHLAAAGVKGAGGGGN